MLEIDVSDSITTQMEILSRYEHALSLRTVDENSPIALVTHKESNDYINGSLLDRTYRRLLDVKLPKITGMSLMELVNLPTYELKLIYKAAEAIAVKETKLIDDIEDEFKE